MNETEKMAYAKSFIDKLAEGINPLDDTPVKDDDIINNVRISRCLYYVSSVLSKAIENETAPIVRMPKPKKSEFYLTDEQAAGFLYSEQPIYLSAIRERLNALKNDDIMKDLSHIALKEWLIKKGYLEERTVFDKKYVSPTESGESLGITSERRVGPNGQYNVNLYDLNAQKFIVSKVTEIARYAEEKKKGEATKVEFSNEDDKTLIETYRDGFVVEEIAKSVNKPIEDVVKRLRYLNKSGRL